MLALAILFLLIIFAVILWHPCFAKIPFSQKIFFIITSTVLASLIYLHRGSPLLPDHPLSSLQNLGRSLPETQTRKKLPFLITAVQKNPQNPLCWKALADAYWVINHYYESTLYYREAWKQAPSNIELKILYTQSLLLFHRGHMTPTLRKLIYELRLEKNLPPLIQFFTRKVIG